MDKKKLKKRKKRIISVAVVATAFVLCIMATFGITMAYFGGKSDTNTGKLTLKSAVWVNSTAWTNFNSAYVLPSQTITQPCEVKVKSSNSSTGTAVKGDAATKALLRASLTCAVTGGLTLSVEGVTSYDVKVGTTAKAAKLMKWTTGTGADNNWYLVAASTTTMSGDATMYEIDTTAGEQTLTFTMTVAIPETIKNSDVASDTTSKTITISLQYTVIQSDFYNNSATALSKTVTNAKTIFDSSNLDPSAEY